MSKSKFIHCAESDTMKKTTYRPSNCRYITRLSDYKPGPHGTLINHHVYATHTLHYMQVLFSISYITAGNVLVIKVK